MWTTGEEIYISFTDGVRRTSQSVIPQIKFVRLWNEWALPEWMKMNMSVAEGVELTQKQTDDLQSVIVKTDGVYEHDTDILYPILPDTNKINIFSLPEEGVEINCGDPAAVPLDTQEYPQYKRMLRVWFRLSASGDWIKSYPLRSIDESFVLNSKYSCPSTTLLYHRTHKDKVEAVTPTGYTAAMMQLMYIRHPNEMSYDSGAIPPIINYTIDLGQEQLEEIRDIGVRLYLERVKDPRWQSFLQEEMLKNIIQK